MTTPPVSAKDLVQEYTRINVDPADIVLSADGIADFSWPYNHKEILAFGNALEHGLADLLANHPDQKNAVVYKIAAKNFVLSICTCFVGEILNARLKQKDQTLNLPESWKIWSNILNDAEPPLPFYIDQIRLERKNNNNPVANRFRQPLKTFKLLKRLSLGSQGVKFDGLYLPEFSRTPSDMAIWATQRLPLIEAHAKKENAPVYLCSSLKFFSHITDEEITAAEKVDDIHLSILHVTQTIFNDCGTPLRSHIRDYLGHVLKRYAALIRVHLGRLSQKKLPKRLWTGTGGNLWDVILRCAVKESGGEVVAHDHGGGVPHLDHPEKGWIEMWSCDRFITYSAEQVKTFSQFMHGWPNLDKRLPVIESLGDSSAKPGQIYEFSQYKERGADIRSVRIFSTIYSSEDGRGLPIYPHMAYIDWQARLIGNLKDSGYEVSFKPHPDSRLPPPRSYEAVLGAKIIETPFDKMDQDFDLYIFDLSNTSVLQAALLTNKPVLVIDFSVMEWRKDAKELFEQRCGYIQGYYEGNRMMIDWTQLVPQVKNAALRCNDHAFARKYYF